MTSGSLRNARDGVTYFGYEKVFPGQKYKNIDFLIKLKNGECDISKYIGIHFQIAFNRNDKKYYIVDLGKGFGTFMKLQNELLLKDNHLINIGNSYIVFSFEDNPNTQNLILKIYNDDKRYDPILLEECQLERKYHVGRDSNCDVVIEDNLLSRIHCTIIYRKNRWSIMDGKGNLKEDGSTNGTWSYLIEETEIYDGMIFKGNQNLFMCKYESSSK